MSTAIRTVLFLIVLACYGCFSGPPTYSVLGSTEKLSRVEAEQAMIESELNVQITPPLDKPIKLIHAPLPEYPDKLRRAELQGNVSVKFAVDTLGNVVRAEVVGVANPEFARVAISTIRQWRFQPISRNGEPITIWLEQPFHFSIKAP